MATQYFANNRKVGDGVTTVWDFSFAGARPGTGDGTETYLEQPDVLVALVDFDTFGLETRTPITTGVTFGPGPAQITVTPAIASGQEFVIYRDTLVETPVADFTDFASISEQDLDFSFRQALFVVQELADTTQDTENFARRALSTAGDAVTTTGTFTARVDSLQADVENLLGVGVSDLVYKSENLSGLPNVAAARANIGVKSIAEAEQYAQDTANAAVAAHVALADPHTQYAERALNLSDLTDAAAARTNLGLGSAAVQPDSRYNIRTSNLGDVADKSIARENLSVVERTSTLGAAVLPAGTTAQRPVGGTGYVRFNTTLGAYEGWDGAAWSGLGAADAVLVAYDNTASGLAATDVQAAVDKLDSSVDALYAGPNFTAMPQVGGDPVVESGSNGNGEWVRWADGTQRCTARQSALFPVGASTWAWAFPLAFAVGPQVLVQYLGGNSGSVYAGLETVDTTAASGIVHNNTGASMSAQLCIVAHGRWK